MKNYLTKNQINYILFHLNQSVEIHEKIFSKFIFAKNLSEINEHHSKIIFLLSYHALDIQNIKWIGRIPILFPLSEEKSFFTIINDNLVFTDDILKSSFYLLSGYQEYNSSEHDNFGRYPFANSIQNLLGISDIPVVNYYFEQIITGLEQFCLANEIAFQRKKMFNTFGFMLTHDIDRVDSYNYYTVGYLFKQLLGFAKPEYDKITTLKVFIISFFHYINLFNKKNSFWTFDYLRQIEKLNGFQSVFYVLKDEGKLDSKYSISEKRILNLLQYLLRENCEIGIHGTMNSALQFESLKNALSELQLALDYRIAGCRQHFLRFFHPQTMLIQEKCGIQYDTSLCFAEHEGFRHSYCLPFKLYHMTEDRMIDVWEFPLNVMEVTLFGYRNMTFEEARESVLKLISEIEKFNGVFTLLWHNCFFDEFKYKGITAFYASLMASVKKKNPKSVTGIDILTMLNKDTPNNFVIN